MKNRNIANRAISMPHKTYALLGGSSVAVSVGHGKGIHCSVADLVDCAHMGKVPKEKTAFNARPLVISEFNMCENLCEFSCQK